MIKKFLFLLSSLFLLPSCYTIHFSKTGSISTSYQTSQWHHIGLLGLMEFSEPVNLEKICPKDSWESVRVRTGFLQGLVRAISIPAVRGGTFDGSMGRFSPNQDTFVPVPLGTFYSPEEVSVSCKE